MYFQRYTGEIRSKMLMEISGMVSKQMPDSNLKQDVKSICQYCYDHRKLLIVLFSSRTDDGFIQLMNKFYQIHFSDSAGTNDNICTNSQTENKLASYYYAGGIFYLIRQWLKEDMASTTDEAADLIYRLITGEAFCSRIPARRLGPLKKICSGHIISTLS